jgi:hypothetical protein
MDQRMSGIESRRTAQAQLERAVAANEGGKDAVDEKLNAERCWRRRAAMA